jgi:hypothetical protein
MDIRRNGCSIRGLLCQICNLTLIIIKICNLLCFIILNLVVIRRRNKAKKYVNYLWGSSRIVCAKCIGLCLGVLLDGEFAAVVTAFGAYVVIHYWSTAVAAGGKLCFLQGVVCSALRCASLRESVFWMWHIIIIFLFIFPIVV